MRTLLAIILATGLHAADGGDGRAADHQALREMMDRAVAALNAGDATALAGCLAQPCDITFADQRHLTSAAGIAEYAARLQSERSIEKITVAPSLDGPARFLGADIALATGSSRDSFTGRDGETTVIPSRWTATCERTPAGWRIAAFHSGVNPLENPILARMQSTAARLLSWAGLAGLVAGGVIGWLFGRRSRGPAA